MNFICSKLHNSDGISIVIALIGFLVATMVSIVIVTAALSSARSVANDKDTTQSRLNVESAAQLIEKKLEETTYTKTVTEYEDGRTDEIEYDKDGYFGADMMGAAKSLDDGSLTGDFSDSFTVTAESDADLLKPVKVAYTMDSQTHDLTLNFIPQTSSGNDDSSGTKICLLMQCYQPVGVKVVEVTKTVETTDENGNTHSETVLDHTITTYTYGWKRTRISSIE